MTEEENKVIRTLLIRYFKKVSEDTQEKLEKNHVNDHMQMMLCLMRGQELNQILDSIAALEKDNKKDNDIFIPENE